MTPHPLPLQVRGAVRAYGSVRAVDGVDLELQPGELLVLVGPSGCGKSTLLRAIAGLDRPRRRRDRRWPARRMDDGRSAAPPERRPVGMVFQDHALFPHLTIGDNVAFGIRKKPSAERKAIVTELLEMVEIDHLAGRYPHEVSGGERQRASVARAVAPRPQLLLLDEPFAALDPNLRSQVRTQLVSPAARDAHTGRVRVPRPGRGHGPGRPGGGDAGRAPRAARRPDRRSTTGPPTGSSPRSWAMPPSCRSRCRDGVLATELGPIDGPAGAGREAGGGDPARRCRRGRGPRRHRRGRGLRVPGPHLDLRRAPRLGCGHPRHPPPLPGAGPRDPGARVPRPPTSHRWSTAADGADCCGWR